MIIAVSDLHLAAYPKNDPANGEKTKNDDAAFISFLNYLDEHQLNSGDKLVLLGDIADYWRRGIANALLDSAPAIDALRNLKINKGVNLYYAAGNHDYYNMSLSGLIKGHFPFEDMDRAVTLNDGGREFLFIHGHQIEMMVNPYGYKLNAYEELSERLCLAGQDIGHIASGVWDTYIHLLDAFKSLRSDFDVSSARESMLKNPTDRLVKGKHHVIDPITDFLEDGKNRVAKFNGYISSYDKYKIRLKEGQVLVLGHTHIPLVSDDELAINIGSWNKDACKAYAFLQIDNGEAKLMEYLGESKVKRMNPEDYQ